MHLSKKGSTGSGVEAWQLTEARLGQHAPDEGNRALVAFDERREGRRSKILDMVPEFAYN
jgi:hypothetical protein